MERVQQPFKKKILLPRASYRVSSQQRNQGTILQYYLLLTAGYTNKQGECYPGIALQFVPSSYRRHAPTDDIFTVVLH